MAGSDYTDLNVTDLQNGTSIDESDIHWWVGLLELFVFVFGVPLNLTVFILVHTSRKRAVVSNVHKRRITEMFVVSMTSADLLFCAVSAPLMFSNFNRDIGLSAVPCLTLFAVTHASTVASSLSLLWLNLNKFLHLHMPLHHFLYITRSRALGCMLISWLASIAWGFLFILGPFITYDAQCNIFLHHKSVYVVFVTVFFVLPAVVSLVISVYVAVVVVEAKTGNSQKYASYFHNRRFYSGVTKDNNNKGSEKAAMIAEPARVHFVNDNNNVETKKPLRSRSVTPPASYKDFYRRRRAFSPAHWPPAGGFRVLSPSARRIAHIRRISFVFTTTIWSTLTVLPYRVAFIVNSLPKPEALQNDDSASISTQIYFCLFAIMTLNAAGNPLITILTQRQYSACLKEVWRNTLGKMTKESKGAIHGSDKTDDRGQTATPAAGDSSERAPLKGSLDERNQSSRSADQDQ